MVTPKYKGTIGILTGGGDVPGLNPAIRAVTLRAIREGYRVIGLRRGWAGITEFQRDDKLDNSQHVVNLTEELVNKIGRSGGTFLHSSRTKPSRMKKADVPLHLQAAYHNDFNDMTPEVVKNLEYLGIDTLIPIGGDDTLSYGVRMHDEGVNVVAIPKTMDNDVPGTDYCIGFGTCVTRTIEMANALRTSAGSHERFLVMEVFGRYAGYTAMLPAMAGAASRCVIPEHEFDVERLTQLMVEDRNANPSLYSVVFVSEGARMQGQDMMFEGTEKDAYGHAKLGGIGERVGAELKARSGRYNRGSAIGVINQKLGYLVRSGDPDALDSIVPMAYGNLALDLILQKRSGRMVALRDGKYSDVEIATVTSSKKNINVAEYYNTDHLCPLYQSFANKPLLLMPAM